MKSPFPYFGGKGRVASVIWERFGDVPNYVEPFFGSGAVLLSRPHAPGIETVNDADALLANFWRALQHDPEAVAYWADWPVNEVDLHARHAHLVDRRAWVEEMMTDPDAYDARLAGWWVWGISQWIGSGWCSVAKRPTLARQLPSLGDGGSGVHRRPHLMTAGKGTNTQRGAAFPSRQLPHLGNAGTGDARPGMGRGGIYAYFEALAERLRLVRVCCGDWSRVLGPSITQKLGTTAIFLDPPYSLAERQGNLYAHDGDSAADVRAWAIANGENPNLRIALAGYDTEHDMPAAWTAFHWKTPGGYGSQSDQRGRTNATRETIWFSPSCLPAPQPTIFDLLEVSA